MLHCRQDSPAAAQLLEGVLSAARAATAVNPETATCIVLALKEAELAGSPTFSMRSACHAPKGSNATALYCECIRRGLATYKMPYMLLSIWLMAKATG